MKNHLNPNSKIEELLPLARALTFLPERGSVTRSASGKGAGEVFPEASGAAIRCGSQTRAPRKLPRGLASSASVFGRSICLLALAFLLASVVARGATASVVDEKLAWNQAKDLVDADVRDLALFPLLERVAVETGWQVFIEPDTSFRASAKFKALPSGEALRRLLGDLNFALVPQSNSPPRLYVFRTVMHNATQKVEVVPREPKRVPNQLLVRVKPGTDIEALAKSLGAHVKGRIPGSNIYRLEFDDAAATDAGRGELAKNSDVTDVEYNYYFDQPQDPRGLLASSASPVSLQLRPPPDSGRVIIGLVDTGVQPLGASLDKFILNRISVAGESNLDPSAPSHGTSMAETMLGSLQEITKGSTSVQILAVDVYGPDQTTTSWNLAQGIVQAVNGGANVINLSSGGPGQSAILSDLLRSVSATGIPIIAAAGNQPVATAFYPAADTGVTAVTALEQGKIAPYANFGPFVAVAAPGTSVVYFGNKPWLIQGTSASSAYVSGLVAGLADTTHQPWSQIQATIRKNLPVPGRGN